MNKELKHRIFDIPQNILDKINHTVTGLNGQNVHGVMRAKKLLTDKKVTYGQLKRIIHDIINMDNYDTYDVMFDEELTNYILVFRSDMFDNKYFIQKNDDEIIVAENIKMQVIIIVLFRYGNNICLLNNIWNKQGTKIASA